MAVALGSKPEVSEIFFVVTRLLHTSQHNFIYYRSVRLVRNPFENTLKIFGLYIVGIAVRVNSQIAQKPEKRFRLFGRRAFVNAVKAGRALRKQKFGYRLVCGNHKLLDNAF